MTNDILFSESDEAFCGFPVRSSFPCSVYKCQTTSQKIRESLGRLRIIFLPRRPDVGPGTVDHLCPVGGGLRHPERRGVEGLPLQHAAIG